MNLDEILAWLQSLGNLADVEGMEQPKKFNRKDAEDAKNAEKGKSER